MGYILAFRIPMLYTIRMIKSFRHKGLQAFFEKGSKSGIQAKHAVKLQIQLTALHAATQPEDMSAPNWKLHKLKGNNPKGQSVEEHWAISVSGNWRLTFYFEGEDAILVDYQDYH